VIVSHASKSAFKLYTTGDTQLVESVKQEQTSEITVTTSANIAKTLFVFLFFKICSLFL
jgi:hypothetical protein